MSPQIIFPMHLVLGYVACLLCFGAYILPRLKSMERIEAQRVIATVHSFRFFGLVFHSSRRRRPQPARRLRHVRRLRRLCNRNPGHPGASHGEGSSALLVVRRRLQSRGNGGHHPRLLPRRQGRSSCAGGAVGRSLCDPDYLCADADDHARRGDLLAGASAAQGGSCPHRRCGRILIQINLVVFLEPHFMKEKNHVSTYTRHRRRRRVPRLHRTPNSSPSARKRYSGSCLRP